MGTAGQADAAAGHPVAKKQDTETASALEQTLQTAVLEGSFDMRGSVGQRWAKSIKSDPKLKSKYKECKGYEAQRSFRQAWAATFWEKVKEERLERVVSQKTQETSGIFEPLEVAIKNEGGSTAAVEGVRKFCMKAMTSESPEKYIRINDWTERLEVNMPKDGWKDTFARRWEVRRTDVAAEKQPDTAKDETAITDGEAKEKGKRGGKKRETSSGPTGGEKKKEKTEFQATVDSLTKTKSLLTATVSSSATMLRSVQLDAAWVWAQKLDEVETIGRINQTLQDFQHNFGFWNDLALLTMLEMRKQYTKAQIQHEFEERHDKAKNLVESLKKVADQLMRMHRARSV